MAEFTKEQLVAQAQENVKALKMAAVQSAFKEIRPAIELDLRLAEIALAALTAGMEQEPVGFEVITSAGEIMTLCKIESGKSYEDMNCTLKPVYAAPQLPQPAVPTFDEWCAATGNKPLGWVKDTMREAYDGCRAAMLQGAEPVQSNTLRDGLAAIRSLGGIDAEKIQAERDAIKTLDVPDGWALVPIKPTREMLGKIHPITEALCMDCGRIVTADCEENVLMSWGDMIEVAPKQSSES